MHTRTLFVSQQLSMPHQGCTPLAIPIYIFCSLLFPEAKALAGPIGEPLLLRQQRARKMYYGTRDSRLLCARCGIPVAISRARIYWNGFSPARERAARRALSKVARFPAAWWLAARELVFFLSTARVRHKVPLWLALRRIIKIPRLDWRFSSFAWIFFFIYSGWRRGLMEADGERWWFLLEGRMVASFFQGHCVGVAWLFFCSFWVMQILGI